MTTSQSLKLPNYRDDHHGRDARGHQTNTGESHGCGLGEPMGRSPTPLHSDAQPKVMEAFSIDSNTGWISTLKDLDHSGPRVHLLRGGLRPRGSLLSFFTALVSVTVTDINDNAPVFAHEVYRGNVKESDPPGRW